MAMLMLCPTVSVGYCWLKVTTPEVAVPAVALMMPQEVSSAVQTVSAAVPYVEVVLRVTVEPATLA